MRHRHFIFLLLALVLASACAKTEIDLSKRSLSFSPVAAKPTKAIIEGTTYPTSESFVVSAYYGGTEAYFENLPASYSSSIDLWETSTSQYWPLSGSLTFYAYSPASASGLSIDATNGVTATDYTIQTNAQMTTDLCYASSTVADCANHPDSAPLTFSHALSQVVFRVKAADYYTTASTTVSLAMTSLSMNGIYSVGNFSAGAWSDQNTEHNYTLSSASTSLTYDANNDPETIDVCSYLFLPQTLSANAKLNVGYSVVQTTSGGTYTLTNPPVSINLSNSITQWEPGKKYIYTLNIGMNNVITFTASTVGWTDKDAEIIVEEN